MSANLGYVDLILFFIVFLHPNLIGCRTFHYAHFASTVSVGIDEVCDLGIDLREREN